MCIIKNVAIHVGVLACELVHKEPSFKKMYMYEYSFTVMQKHVKTYIYMYVFPKYHCWVTLYGAQDVVKSNNIYLVLEYRCKSNIIFIIKI